jgi:smad nuclear-interacting protein 1
MSHQHHHRRGEPKFEFGKTSSHKEPEYEYGKKYSKEGGGGNTEEEAKTVPPKEKEKPTLALSGNLAKDTNTFNGVVVKYNEPPEARKPIKRWRLYCFKGETELPFYPMHRQSAYLFGRDRLVADIPVEHPSCSKQHAVFQYRMVEYRRKDGTTGRTIKPYLIDLGSTNGSFINNNQIEPQRYAPLCTYFYFVICLGF